MSDERDVDALRTVADYQFGRGAGEALFDGEVEIQRTGSGRPQQVLVDGERVVSYGTDGRVTLSAVGGKRLQTALSPPAYRVIVGDDSEPFVRDEKNVFAKFVREVDPAIRPGDEVLVEHYDGDLLAVGRAELSAAAMADFETGMAVAVRDGNPE
ncbi:MiaB-like tRNA modifying enzyme [Natronomonas pharaonis DSM 2160]|uniref:MiaB-like tRNA modifying enzyme n=1 Tax=Natronomonas pharaonis (strain ATCC 35678 / DSM 2160 / CIP 103997 / JCM 8858 / NBRC 14720 / NCIMB 2260 / Gabara) TaxID=348780 RepID=A0A1U7ETM4_NATPD|nr:PUA domain-containing protein [Natronomonas pharaonis]CAI48267.1 MiaB-like tRNA modifying enzyme [Natronomonas pharaonis DSM 2160]